MFTLLICVKGCIQQRDLTRCLAYCLVIAPISQDCIRPSDTHLLISALQSLVCLDEPGHVCLNTIYVPYDREKVPLSAQPKRTITHRTQCQQSSENVGMSPALSYMELKSTLKFSDHFSNDHDHDSVGVQDDYFDISVDGPWNH